MTFVERSYKVIVLFRDKPLATSFVVDPHCCTLLEHDTVGCIGWGRGAGTSTSSRSSRSLGVGIFDQSRSTRFYPTQPTNRAIKAQIHTHKQSQQKLQCCKLR